MSDIKHSGQSAGTRRANTIKVAPMTRAVRLALAASFTALALGTGSGALAADVVIDNVDPITEIDVLNDVTAISGYSSDGNVGITNHAGADLYAGSVFGDALGIYAYAATGDASVTNAADITAISDYGLADGIFASGGDVEATNSGAIESYGYAWSAGIEAQGSDLAAVDNSGDITAVTSSFLQVVDDLGDLVGYSAGGQAFAIYATGGDGGARVSNSGNISVQGGYVTGIEVRSGGDITVDNSGKIVAGSGYTSYYDAGNQYTYYSGTQVATGIDATSGGEGAAVAVTNSGDISVDSIYGASGIAATSAGYGGTASVENSGNIHASQYNFSGYGAYGIVVSADGEGSLDNSGDIEVSSGGVANGVTVMSFAGEASVTNTGDMDIVSTASAYYGASGIMAFSLNGTANVDNTGDVSASSYSYLYASGRAVDAHGQQSVTVQNSGSLYAMGANAYGVYALSSGGDVAVDNAAGGEIGFYSYFGNGFGVLGVAYGDADIDNAGTIEGYAYGQSAGLFGFSYAGDVHAGNSGSIAVTSGGYEATGIIARADYGFATVENSGDITALGSVYATGISATSLYGTAIDSSSGSIYVSAPGGYISYYGYYIAVGSAFGIDARSTYGDVAVGNASDITVLSAGAADVAGINVAGQANITVSNSGDIKASTLYGQAYGINTSTYAHTAGTTTVTNSGDISVEAPASPFGHANGISAFRQYEGDVVVANSGDIDVQAGGRSYGVYAHTKYGDASVTNSGSITMLSQSDAQTGIQVGAGTFFGGGGAASVFNSGDISIDSGYGLAVGIGSIAGAAFGYDLIGDSYIYNSGDIDASAERFAYGIQARGAESATVVNAGDLHVTSSYSNYSYYNYATAGGIAVLSFSGGDLSIRNAGDITVASFEDAEGFYANGGGAGDISITNSGDVSVHTGTTIARGVFAQSYYGDITVSNSGSIVASADEAALASVAIHVKGLFGESVLNNAGGIHASGSGDTIGVLFQSQTGATTLNNASSGTISVEGVAGHSWAVYGSFYAADTINNAGLIAGSIGLYGGDDSINNLAGGTLRLDNDAISLGTSVNGNAFNNAGTIIALGDSLVDLGEANVLPFVNTGSISLLDGAADDSLTITGDLGGKGALDIDVLATDGVADHLIVTGNMVAGAVQTVIASFNPSALVAAQSGESIDFAWVSGDSTAGSFAGGSISGFDASNFLDLGLTVSSHIDSANSAADVFSLRVDVLGLNDTGTLAASAAAGAAGMLDAQLGTLKQRMGVNPYGDEGKAVSAFFRTYSSDGGLNPAHEADNFGQGGNFDYDQSTWGREVGFNANLPGNFHAGLTLGTADGRQRLSGNGIGENRMDGTTWGAYATWFVPQGFYVDLSGRWMAVDVESTSAAGQVETRAHTRAWNLEAGYQWMLGGVSVVPQLQYTRTEVDDLRAIHGSLATLESDGGSSSRGRMGVEISKSFQSGALRWTPYGSINAIREFDGEMAYTVAQVFQGTTSLKGTSTMAELGLGLQKNDWIFTIGADWTGGGALESTVGGQAMLRFAW